MTGKHQRKSLPPWMKQGYPRLSLLNELESWCRITLTEHRDGICCHNWEALADLLKKLHDCKIPKKKEIET